MRWKTCLVICTVALQMTLSPMASGQSSRLAPEKPKTGKVNGQGSADWPLYGRDLAGSHYNPTEKKLTPETVGRLKVKWTFETGADVSSQPTVVGGVVYFGSWDGKEYAIDAESGKKIWEFDTGGYPSRSGSSYAGGVLYFADGGGRMFALNARDGSKIWQIKVDPHPMTI